MASFLSRQLDHDPSENTCELYLVIRDGGLKPSTDILDFEDRQIRGPIPDERVQEVQRWVGK